MAGKHAGTAQAVIGADGMLEQSHPDCLGDQGRGHPLSIAVTEHCEKPAWGEGLLWHMVSAHQFDPDVSGHGGRTYWCGLCGGAEPLTSLRQPGRKEEASRIERGDPRTASRIPPSS